MNPLHVLRFLVSQINQFFYRVLSKYYHFLCCYIMDIDDNSRMHTDDGKEDDLSMEDSNPQTGSQNVESSSQNPKKKRKKRKLTSKVWQSFTILEQEPNQPLYCKCNKCGKKYLADSTNGTGNLSRHLLKCTKSTTKEIGQYMVDVDDGVLDMRTSNFNQERFRELLIYALARHDLPFSFVEYEGIRNIFKYLEPSVSFISRNTAKSDIRKLYQREKSRLRGELIKSPGRICLTSDCWTSIVTDGYLSLTAHYIDSNWVLQKRILNFAYMPPPHTGIALAEKISGLVKSWGIEKKLFSITLDNAYSNDVCVNVLRNQFRLMNFLVLDGKLFHLRCCCHVLNLIVKDGLKQIDVAVDKVREYVKYVKGSEARKDKFSECCSQTNLDCKKALTQDVPTRWNFTYKMLSCALYYRLAFCHLSLSDSNFKSCPSIEEWERVEKI
ncbi:putative transcription factor/ chromatin remodeling BED-type(Zn) family [Helianthus debilis subsp. tardiflorus]